MASLGRLSQDARPMANFTIAASCLNHNKATATVSFAERLPDVAERPKKADYHAYQRPQKQMKMSSWQERVPEYRIHNGRRDSGHRASGNLPPKEKPINSAQSTPGHVNRLHFETLVYSTLKTYEFPLCWGGPQH
jgi:hypothetical protein